MRAVLNIIKWVGIALAGIILLFLAVLLTTRTIKAAKYKIRTEKGIQESTYVELGGIKQYIQIRGEDINNPVIIFLHGGPGSPMAYVSYHYQTELESEYTIVNWDQRGSGRTYYANPDMNMEEELSTDILLSDLNDLVDYLRERFGQDKAIIMGHSWGTVLGSMYAKEHPEKVSAYIGIGHAVDVKGGKIMAAYRAIEHAKAEGNEKDAAKLSAGLEKFAEAENFSGLDVMNFAEMAALSLKNLPYEGKMSAIKQMWLGLSSPYVSLNDLRWFIMLMDIKKTFKLEAPVMEELLYNFDVNKQSKEFKVPVYFISGDNDWTTPTPMVKEYYKSIEAPDKDMIIIKNAGHSPFIENPDDFCKAVKTLLSN
jgi:pimeloyl-ACP methyl ester carboxylesterase